MMMMLVMVMLLIRYLADAYDDALFEWDSSHGTSKITASGAVFNAFVQVWACPAPLREGGGHALRQSHEQSAIAYR